MQSVRMPWMSSDKIYLDLRTGAQSESNCISSFEYIDCSISNSVSCCSAQLLVTSVWVGELLILSVKPIPHTVTSLCICWLKKKQTLRVTVLTEYIHNVGYGVGWIEQHLADEGDWLEGGGLSCSLDSSLIWKSFTTTLLSILSTAINKNKKKKERVWNEPAKKNCSLVCECGGFRGLAALHACKYTMWTLS